MRRRESLGPRLRADSESRMLQLQTSQPPWRALIRSSDALYPWRSLGRHTGRPHLKALTAKSACCGYALSRTPLLLAWAQKKCAFS
jgi:hypothetical protein